MRLFILIFLLVAFKISLTGQNFGVGVSTGINASQVSGDSFGGFNKAGINAGIFSVTELNEKFNFQFEINLSEKGSRKNARPDKNDLISFIIRMRYIEVPLILQYKKKRFTYEAGLAYSRLISTYLEDQNGETTIAPGSNQFKNSDYTGLVGINFNFTEHLLMNWRFSSSIGPFRDFKIDPNLTLPFNGGMFHHYIAFTFKYQFLGTNGK